MLVNPADLLTIFLIAVGLSMDTFAVSIGTGITSNIEHRRKNALVMSSFFAGFQILMPIIGWVVGLDLQNFVASAGSWIAFALLLIVGLEMIYETTKKEPDRKQGSLRLSSLLVLSIATSIDALMVGMSFALLKTSIALPVAVIGTVTFSLSFAGFIFGCSIGQVFERRVRILGGLILIGIGLRILLGALL